MAMARKAIIYQIYFDDNTKKYINQNCIGYDNSLYHGKEKQPFFENHIIKQLIEEQKHKDSEYFGVLSWQFETKNSYFLKNIHDDIDKNADHDIYSFYKAHTQPNVWRVAEGWHQGIIETSQHIFNRFNGLKISHLNTPTIYQNAHVTKSEIYEDYVKTWLIPLMDIMNDAEDVWLQKQLWRDTKYKSYTLKKTKIENVTGVPYYPMHTFICERFFSTYLTTKKFKIKQLC
jgi:hypothetical protein